MTPGIDCCVRPSSLVYVFVVVKKQLCKATNKEGKKLRLQSLSTKLVIIGEHTLSVGGSK